MRAPQHSIWIVLIVSAVLLSAFVATLDFPVETISNYAAEHRLLGAMTLILIAFLATVFAPIAMIGIVPLLAPILGPFTTAVACIVGWVLGAIAAFLIARHGGRPLLKRFIDMDAIARYEAAIPQKAHFLLLIMLRMAIPVDVLSYALGLVSNVSLTMYTITTTIGVLWFAFAFAYLGNAFFEADYVLFVGIGVASVLIFALAVLYVRKHRNAGGTDT